VTKEKSFITDNPNHEGADELGRILSNIFDCNCCSKLDCLSIKILVYATNFGQWQ